MAQTLRSLLKLFKKGSPEAIAALLDARSHDERLAQMYDLEPRHMARLYAVAEKAPILNLDYFVPSDAAPLKPVHHIGFNSLPVLDIFRKFEKRFTKPLDGSNRLFGYNEGVLRPVIGPGYYVARETFGQSAPDPRGGVVIDYTLSPDGTLPPAWPTFQPNSEGLQRFVYKGTLDYMRRVSHHMTVGAAFAGERAMGAYFILVRHDLP